MKTWYRNVLLKNNPNEEVLIKTEEAFLCFCLSIGSNVRSEKKRGIICLTQFTYTKAGRHLVPSLGKLVF